MCLSIAEQLRKLGLISIAPRAVAAFEPPGAYLKRLHKDRERRAALNRDGYPAPPSDGIMMDAYRTGQARYEKFVPAPHASPQWGDPRITASGI